MENSLNRKKLLNYCKRFSQKVTERFYQDKTRIGGSEIIELTSIKQINLFVIKNLFKEWQKETGKLESKYFDYQNEEVRVALKEFMNILSKNISIAKDDFIPLLEKSVEEAVLLIFLPYDYYTHMMDQSIGDMSVDELKRSSKYVKVNKNLLSGLMEKIDEEGLQSLDKTTFLKLLNYVFENIQGSPEDIEEYLLKFSAIEPLREEDIYGDQEEPKRNTEDSIETPEVPLSAQEDYIDPAISSTLNDQLSSDTRPTLADVHQNKKIESLKNTMSINQRFMFINNLFDGDDEKYSETVDYIDQCGTKKEALEYIRINYSEWDAESEEVEEFMELLNKRLP